MPTAALQYMKNADQSSPRASFEKRLGQCYQSFHPSVRPSLMQGGADAGRSSTGGRTTCARFVNLGSLLLRSCRHDVRVRLNRLTAHHPESDHPGRVGLIHGLGLEDGEKAPTPSPLTPPSLPPHSLPFCLQQQEEVGALCTGPPVQVILYVLQSTMKLASNCAYVGGIFLCSLTF